MIEREVDFSNDDVALACPDCGDRVAMTFEARDNGQSRICRGGHTVSAREELPWITDPDDLAAQHLLPDLAWYHTSTRPDWSPTDDSPESIATQLGTLEAAVENMLRRMRDQNLDYALTPEEREWRHVNEQIGLWDTVETGTLS